MSRHTSHIWTLITAIFYTYIPLAILILVRAAAKAWRLPSSAPFRLLVANIIDRIKERGYNDGRR